MNRDVTRLLLAAAIAAAATPALDAASTKALLVDKSTEADGGSRSEFMTEGRHANGMRLKLALEERGYTVTRINYYDVAEASDAQLVDWIDNHDLLVITWSSGRQPTVTGYDGTSKKLKLWAGRFDDHAPDHVIPAIVTRDPRNNTTFGMLEGQYSGGDYQDTPAIDIIDPSHPVMGGLDGLVVLPQAHWFVFTNSESNLSSGTRTGAMNNYLRGPKRLTQQKISPPTAKDPHYVVWWLEQGATKVDGSRAPARRVQTIVPQPDRPNASLSLHFFNAALDWVTRGQASVQLPEQTTPAAPSGCVATSPGASPLPSYIDLRWSDNATNEVGYHVERSSGGGSFQHLVTLTENTESYRDIDVSAGTTYTYRVRAWNRGTRNSNGTWNHAVSAASNESTATAPRVVPRVADDVSGASARLEYEYFEKTGMTSVYDLPSSPVKTGTNDTFDLSPRERGRNFGFVHRGWIDAPATGEYLFITETDDGSVLSIDGIVIVDNDRQPGNLQDFPYQQHGRIHLEAGLHPIEVLYYQDEGGFSFNVEWDGPGFGRQSIPASALFHGGTVANPQPSVTIDSPADGASVATTGSQATVTVSFTVRNHTVAQGDSHVHVLLDGTIAFMRFDTQPFDIDVPLGSHTITVALVDANHQPIGVSDAVSVNVVSSNPTPHGNGGQPWPVADASRIPVEDFDDGGSGVGYLDSDAGNNGDSAYRSGTDVDLQTTSDTDDDGNGVNLAWARDGEWLRYTVSVDDGLYDVDLRVASGDSAPGSVRLLLDGAEVATVDVPGTGGWQSWRTVTASGVDLAAAGDAELRLEIVGGSFNLNWIAFRAAGGSGGGTTASRRITVAAVDAGGPMDLDVAVSPGGATAFPDGSGGYVVEGLDPTVTYALDLSASSTAVAALAEPAVGP